MTCLIQLQLGITGPAKTDTWYECRRLDKASDRLICLSAELRSDGHASCLASRERTRAT
jgi:hypothetical protein